MFSSGHPPKRVRGVVKVSRGTYGFIKTEGGDQLYYHKSDVEVGITLRTLDVGTRVEFELAEDHQGRTKAVNVRQVSMAHESSPYRE